ncbi:MAG: sulfate transporter CysZ [Gammaproteobacteria bacterium]
MANSWGIGEIDAHPQKTTESLFDSLSCGLRGLRLVFRPEFRRYVWIPVLLNSVLFGAAFWLSGSYFAAFLEWLIPDWLNWLRYFLWPVFGLIFLLGSMFSFTLVANLLGSFFYGSLARKVRSGFPDDRAGGEMRSAEGGWIRDFSSEIRRLFYYLTRALVLLPMFVIPGLNLIAPFLWLMFSAWFLGLEYMAYSLDESGLTFPEQRRLLKPYRIAVTAFGGLAILGLAVPILNLVVPPAAVIGATLYVRNKTSFLSPVWKPRLVEPRDPE